MKLPKFIVAGVLATLLTGGAHAACQNAPLLGADLLASVCYECMLPLKIASIPVLNGPMPDVSPDESSLPICSCPMPPPIFVRIGVPVSFFNPSRVVETVTEPLCFPSLGVSLGGLLPQGMLGGNSSVRDSRGAQKSFFQGHELIFPVFAILDLFMDVMCLQNADPDVAYMTEVDPFWNIDMLGVFLTPEAVLFGNPATGLACMADAAASQAFLTIDPMFWCKGSHGMSYPMTGSVDSKGIVEDSASAAENMIYALHRRGLGTHDSLCAAIPTPIWKKSDYRLQIVKPVPNPIGFGVGQSSIIWGSAKNPPFKGDNFAYMRFKKINCCVW